MNPGIYRGITNAAYHGGEGVSKSMLDVLQDRSPQHLHYLRTHANDNEPTPAQVIGTAFHALLLEPEEFAKTYTLPLSIQDAPGAIADRDALVAIADEINAKIDAQLTEQGVIRKAEDLVAIIEELNKTRLPKLQTSGSKGDLLARIQQALPDMSGPDADEMEAMKAPELKAVIEKINLNRPGLLSTSGSIDQLANTVRAAGRDVLLLRDLKAQYKAETGQDYFIDTAASMPELAAAIRATGREITLLSEVKEEWQRNNGHRIVLSHEQFEQLREMRDSVMRHPAANALLTRAKNVVVDVKTTEDASVEEFARSIANWGYHRQHPFYLDGLRLAIEQAGLTDADLPQGEAELSAYWIDPETDVLCRCRPDFWRGRPDEFFFLAVEKKAPYAVSVFWLDEESVALGRRENRAALDLYAQCLANDNWPAYPESIQKIRLPNWKLASAA